MSEPLFDKLELFPYPPVSTRYGACFGNINKLALANSEKFAEDDWTLRADAQETVAAMTSRMNALLAGSKGLIFCSSTGLQVDDHPCYGGPWGMNYYPTLFRRALLTTDSPVIFLLDGSKWNRNLAYEHPFPVFTKKEWERWRSTKALRFCISTYLPHKRDGILRFFNDLGYKIIRDQRRVNEREMFIILALSPPWSISWESKFELSQGGRKPLMSYGRRDT